MGLPSLLTHKNAALNDTKRHEAADRGKAPSGLNQLLTSPKHSLMRWLLRGAAR